MPLANTPAAVHWSLTNEWCVANERLQPGQQVKFRLGDVHLPEPQEVIARMTEDTELQGSITLLSDQGEKRSAFAVIEVNGILMPLIVPTSLIKVIASSADTNNTDASDSISQRTVALKTDALR